MIWWVAFLFHYYFVQRFVSKDIDDKHGRRYTADKLRSKKYKNGGVFFSVEHRKKPNQKKIGPVLTSVQWIQRQESWRPAQLKTTGPIAVPNRAERAKKAMGKQRL